MYTQRRQPGHKHDSRIQSSRSGCLRRRRRGELRWSTAIWWRRAAIGLQGGAGLNCIGKQSEQRNENRTHCENDMMISLTT